MTEDEKDDLMIELFQRFVAAQERQAEALERIGSVLAAQALSGGAPIKFPATLGGAAGATSGPIDTK